MKTKLLLSVLLFFYSYQVIQAQWTQIGEDIYGELAGDFSGYAVSMNAIGDIVAIGSPKNSDVGEDSGQVRVCKNISGTWTQMGDDVEGDPVLGSNIIGDTSNDYSGQSLCLNNDGNKIAIGAPSNDVNGDKSGQVKVLQYNNSSSVTDLIEDTITIYPNPFINTFSLKSIQSSVIKLSIADASGKIVKEISKINPENQIDLSELHKGYYLVNILTDKGLIIKKIIKKQ